MDIHSYLDQHNEAAQLVGQLEKKLINPTDNAKEIISILSALIGKLIFHISMEDKFIYPKATKSGNDNLKNIAYKMQYEMGEIGKTLNNYSKNWVRADQIKAHPNDFTAATKGIIKALKYRISAEEKEFYPLVKEYL